MRITFPQQRGHRAFEPGIDLADRCIDAGWRIKDSRVGDDREELVHARPRYAPRHMTLGEALKACLRRSVPVRIRAVRIDENVRIRRDQLPRPL